MKFRCFHGQFLIAIFRLCAILGVMKTHPMTTRKQQLILKTSTVFLHVTWSSVITWPTMGFLQAPQTPLATVWTPSRLRSDCRLPSMLSSLLAGLGGPVGEVFPWDWICWRTRRTRGASRKRSVVKIKGRLTSDNWRFHVEFFVFFYENLNTLLAGTV